MSDVRVLPNGIVERTKVEDGKLWDVRTQDVDRHMDWVQHMRDAAAPKHGQAAWRFAGSIPLVIAEKWAQECGAQIGSPEFSAYAKRKLMDGEFAKFRVKGF